MTLSEVREKHPTALFGSESFHIHWMTFDKDGRVVYCTGDSFTEATINIDFKDYVCYEPVDDKEKDFMLRHGTIAEYIINGLKVFGGRQE